MTKQEQIDKVRALEKAIGLQPGSCERRYDGEKIIGLTLPLEHVEALAGLTETGTELLRRMDVTLPQITGMATVHALRTGGGANDAPPFQDQIEDMRALLGLPNPAATPQEFYPEGYCKTCDGGGKVNGGDGIPDPHTLMNMRRYVTKVLDRPKANEWLRSHLRWVKDEERLAQVDALLDNLPLEIGSEDPGQTEGKPKVFRLRSVESGFKVNFAVKFEGQDDWTWWGDRASAVLPHCFETEHRRCDWDRPAEERWKDICPSCEGTGGRGLPLQTVE